MLMIDPPPFSRIAGMAALVPRKTPLAFTEKIRSQSSPVVSSMFLRIKMPALFSKMSSLPYVLTAACTADSQSDSLVTSRWTYVTL